MGKGNQTRVSISAKTVEEDLAAMGLMLDGMFRGKGYTPVPKFELLTQRTSVAAQRAILAAVQGLIDTSRVDVLDKVLQHTAIPLTPDGWVQVFRSLVESCLKHDVWDAISDRVTAVHPDMPAEAAAVAALHPKKPIPAHLKNPQALFHSQHFAMAPMGPLPIPPTHSPQNGPRGTPKNTTP